MAKKLLLLGIVVAMILVICFVLCSIREAKAIPLLHSVCFGMTPKQVMKQLGDYLDICQDIGGTDKTAYLYEISVLDCDATVTCFFLNDQHLTEVEIRWDVNRPDVYDRAYSCLYEYYSNNKNFFTKESQHPDEKYVRTLIGIDDGVTGLFYSFYSTDDYIIILCTDNS